jgi:hypothetical protein
MWSELNSKCMATDVVQSEGAASQVCSGPWGLSSPGSVQVCSQPKGVEQKKREHKLSSGVNWHGALKQKGVKQRGVWDFLPGAKAAQMWS